VGGVGGGVGGVGGVGGEIAVADALLIGTHTPLISIYPILHLFGFNAFEEYTSFILL
jgi:hypothetical protein